MQWRLVVGALAARRWRWLTRGIAGRDDAGDPPGQRRSLVRQGAKVGCRALNRVGAPLLLDLDDVDEVTAFADLGERPGGSVNRVAPALHPPDPHRLDTREQLALR